MHRAQRGLLFILRIPYNTFTELQDTCQVLRPCLRGRLSRGEVLVQTTEHGDDPLVSAGAGLVEEVHERGRARGVGAQVEWESTGL